MAPLPETYVQGFHEESYVSRMPYLPFGATGLKVSKVSLGTGTLSKLYGELGETEGAKAVQLAVRRGINYIDTAPFYGQGRSEEILGQALKTIPRNAYYVATKVGRYGANFADMFDYTATRTRQSVENSLRLLGVDCIDVVQIHDIEFAPNLDVVLNETLPTLETLKAEGKLRHIGVSAYPLDVLKQLISRVSPGRFDTVLCYCRNTLFDDSLRGYLPFFAEHRLAVICASGHAMGLLTNAGPQPWHPAHDHTKAICREAGEYCARNGIELGKLAMHGFLQLPGPATFLSGMQTERLVEINLDACLHGLNRQERDVLEHVTARILSKIQHKHWEGIEVERYRTAMAGMQ